MKNINKAQILGHLGADPVIRDVGNGRMAQLRVATSESWKNKQTGEREERTEWHTIELWIPSLVDLVDRYLGKGSRIYAEGQIQTRKWQDKQGQDRYTTSIAVRPFNGCLIMLDGRKAEAGYGTDAPPPPKPSRSRDIPDDDIPF